METDAELHELLENVKRIAVLGIKSGEDEDAFRVPRYMQQKGYRIVPVNPKLASVLGETAYTVPGLLLVIAAGVALAAVSFALVLPAEFREFRALLGRRRRPAPPA